jgi:hypothetical protein
MIVLDPGHLYQLQQLGELKDNTDIKYGYHNTLRFVKREGPGYPGNSGTYPGTIIQDVLRACIDRLKYVDNQISSPNNLVAIEHLRWAIFVLESRAAQRHGAQIPIVDRKDIETIPTEENGHWKFQENSL